MHKQSNHEEMLADPGIFKGVQTPFRKKSGSACATKYGLVPCFYRETTPIPAKINRVHDGGTPSLKGNLAHDGAIPMEKPTRAKYCFQLFFF